MTLVLVIAASISFGIGGVVPVHADTGGYPWPTAPCAHTGATTGTCTNYDWGLMTRPDGDTYATKVGDYYVYDNWGYGFRNCTSYVAWKISREFGGRSVSGWGDAKTWWDIATTSGTGHPYTSDDGNPQVGDIAVWTNGSFGHVAYVAAVDSNKVATFYEYNAAATGEFTSTYTSSTHPLVGGGGGHAPDHYIHMGTPADSGTSGGTSTTSSANWSGNFATSWGSGRLDTFVKTNVTSGNNVNHKWYGGSWNWDALPALNQQVTSWPSAVSWGPGRMDVFATASNGNLLQAYYDGIWHDWAPIGGADTCIVGAPGVSSWGPNRLDVFAQRCYDNGNTLMHIYYDGAWHGWEILPVTGFQMGSAPSAVSWSLGRIDVFAQSTSNGRPIQAYFDANGWHGWFPLGASNTCITGAPGVSTWGVNRLDLFAMGCNTPGLFHSYFNGSWSGWETIDQTVITTSPSAVSWGSGRIDVFARGSGSLLHRYFDASGWHTWEDLGGSLAS